MLDLRSGRPVWSLESPTVSPWPDLECSRRADVVVVGAGITGALSAVRLARAGAHVVVLDRRPAARGSTLASTALVQYDIDVPLVRLRQCLGAAAADRAYRRSAGAVHSLGDLIATLDDDAGWCLRPSAYLAASLPDAQVLMDEARARREIGLDVVLLDEREVRQRFPFHRPAAIWSALAAEVDPQRLTLAALRAAESAGAIIRTGDAATVERVERAGERCRLECAGGDSVQAPFVVMATGYESQRYFTQPVAALKSTYAMAFEPEPDLSSWPERCLVWETADPYLYCRTTPMGRVVIGGEDIAGVDDTRRDALLPEKVATLRRRARELWPQLKLVPETAWAGTFAETADGLPVIGRPDGGRGAVRFAVGYGGNGITFSEMASHLMLADFQGQEDPDAELFSFERPTL